MARNRPPPRTLRVLAKTRLTPNMLRVTLGGAGLEGFPDDQDGAYIKLNLPRAPAAENEFAIRTYTVRHYRPDAGELDIDFVLHDIEGPAALWAANCRAGDEIGVGGPGPKKLPDYGADWFLFAGDMSALPAISANLEALPRAAVGVAFLEIIDARDRQHIAAPDGLKIEWLVNPHPESENTTLLEAVTQFSRPEGAPYYWIAGEFSQSLAIRAYLRAECEATRGCMYASSYWQIGQTEDGHRLSKAGVRDG